MSEKIMEFEFKPRITEESQILAALQSNAAAFQALGGAPLMLTEAVENSSDAIIEKRRLLKTQLKGLIELRIDTKLRRVTVVDNGIGIQRPIYIIENPFKSLKKNFDILKGEYGRGLQGFRGFCNELMYISRRINFDEEEKRYLPPDGYCRTIRLGFHKDRVAVKYSCTDDRKFAVYSKSDTGTVAIYKDWTEEAFESVSRVQDLHDRIQHHFGELVRKGNVKITIQVDDGRITEVAPREFDPADKFPIDPIEVKDHMGNSIGKIEFYVYKAPRLKHKYKKPYLLVDDRPLQNSFISQMPEFEGDTHAVWKSNNITGYVRCDFVKPNQLRMALENDENTELFMKYLATGERQLKTLVREFSRSLEEAELEENMKDIRIDVQTFLKSEPGFNFKLLTEQGILDKIAAQSDKVGVDSGNGDSALFIPGRTGA